ncbi:MAG: tetratricopeptide repeat protein [Candidatus Melainabacteria bacterium]|nr:tetratricopeptide repeat protein [Candidatus Melainabacteria bacterium]
MKKIILALSFTLLVSNVVPIEAMAQSKHWDIKRRDEAANLTSAGLNYLTDKKQKKKRKEKDNIIFASKFFEKAVNVYPENVTALNLLALCLTFTNETDRALTYLQKASQLGGQDNENLATTGIAQYLNHNFEVSVNVWNKLFKVSQDKGPALTCLGYGLIRRGDFNKAIKCFEQAQQLAPQSAFVLDGASRAYYFLGDFENAKSFASRANALGEYNFTTALKARADMMQGNYAEAQKGARRLTSKPTQYKMGRSLAFLGFSKLYDLEADPFQLDNQDSGLSISARIKDMQSFEPRKGQANQQVQSYKPQAGKISENLDKVRASMSLSKDDYYLEYQLGLIQACMGDFSGAQNSFESALRRNPQAMVILLDLAYVYFRQDQKAKAASCVQSFKQQWPNMKLSPFYEQMLLSPATNTANPNKQDPFATNQPKPNQPKEDPLDNNPKDSGF